MGLDTVELVMEFEDEFELAIPDEQAEKISTIGETVAYIVGVLRLTSPAPMPYCRTARAFYRLRREMHRHFRTPRRLVMPSSQIGTLVPKTEQRARWSEVAAACNLDAGCGVGSFLPAFPRPTMTIRQLIHARGFSDKPAPRTYYLPNGEVNTRAVWTKVQQIVSEQMGVDRAELKWDTHYIYDLDAG